MNFSRKALYNLLRNNWKENPSIEVKSWQVEDYRTLSLEAIFDRLKKINIVLNHRAFILHAEESDSPEELLEQLWTREDEGESQDEAYLLLLELWRRLLPDKRSVSIFCDDLDDAIERYSQAPTQSDEEIQKLLKEMEDILDDSVDLGAESKALFASIEESTANDIEGFLYNYIVDQIEENNNLYASDLLDGFYDYISDSRWFDFLRARLFGLTSLEEANLILTGLLEQLEESPHVDLLFEIASYLATAGDHELFSQAIKQGVAAAEGEEDLNDFLELVSEYYRCLDKDEKVQEIQTFLKQPHLQLSADKNAVLQFL